MPSVEESSGELPLVFWESSPVASRPDLRRALRGSAMQLGQRAASSPAMRARLPRSARNRGPHGGNPSSVTDALAARAAQPAFRQEALQDGGPAGRQMPTTYPHPESVWQEYFAESFAMFQTSPDLLRRLRPNVFHFMAQTFPP